MSVNATSESRTVGAETTVETPSAVRSRMSRSPSAPMFGTTIEQEYAVAARLLDLDEAGVADLARTAVMVSFLSPAGKQKLHAEIDTYVAGE